MRKITLRGVCLVASFFLLLFTQDSYSKTLTNDSCARNVFNTKVCGSGTEYLMYLNGKHLKGDVSSYQWVRRSDGSVRISAEKLTTSSFGNDTISFEVVYSNPTSSAPAGSPKGNNCGSYSTSGWLYYPNVVGTFTSKNHGTFTITRKGPAFQQGNGANQTQLGYGASGWFYASGGDGYYTSGDFNMMLGTTCNTINKNKIKGTVFTDANADGDLDAGELGTPNVDVFLFTDENCDGIINGNDEKIGQTTTAADGSYELKKGYICNQSTQSTFTKRIISYACDAEEYSNGTMDRYSGDLDLGQNNVGVRYQGVTVPQGATIVSAKIKFRAKSTSSHTGSVTIYGNDVSTASGHSGNNYDITSRTKTTANVTWNISSWNRYSYYCTPDLSSIVQEIVNRNDWSSGNYMHFPIPKTSSGHWPAYSFDCAQSSSAQLEIVYTTSSCEECLIVKVDQTDLDPNCSLTTDSTYSFSFTSANNCDANNDFGCTAPPAEDSCKRVVSHTYKCSNNTKYLLWLSDKNSNTYHLSGDESTFSWTQRDDGSVRFQAGGFVHPNLTNDTFSIDVVFDNPQNSAPSGSPKWSYCGSVDTSGWLYYLTTTGTLTSKLHGDFDVSRAGPAFQVGDGANTTAQGFGASGWMYIKNGNGQYVSGDLNMMLSTECTSENPNKITGTVFEDSDGDGEIDVNETLTEDVIINLYSDENCNGKVDGSDAILATDTTDSDGTYTFNQDFTCTTNSTTTFSKGVISSSCDSEETSCSMNTTSSDLDLGQRYVGIRYQGVTVPQGATIVSAKLTFTAHSNYSNTGTVRIYGHDVNTAPAFQTSSCNISNRTKTTAYTDWNVTSWTANQQYATADLGDIVQEIVNRPGWTSGNYIAFLIPQVSGKHWGATSFNGSYQKSPQIEIVYEDQGCEVCYTIDIDGSTIPNKRIVSSDSLLDVSFTSGNNCSEDNNFTLNTYNIIGGTVFHDPNRDGNHEAGERPVPNAFVYLVKDENCDGDIDNEDEAIAKTLTDADGNYEFIQPFICGSSIGSTTINSSVTEKADDAEESSSGSMDLTSSDLDMNPSEQHYVGLRFKNLNIPQGAEILEAYVTFKADDTDGSSTYIGIYAEDTDNANTFTTSSKNISSRTRTSEAVKWDVEGWINGREYRTPNLNKVVEEVVGRSGWSSNNSMAFVFYNDSGERDACSIESGSTAPKLTVKYKNGSSCADCFIVKFDETQLKKDTTLTTPGEHSVIFTAGCLTSDTNDFGYWHMDPVPVELLFLNGYRDGDNVDVVWSTATEINNSHFMVQRSIDGSHYESIGRVEGNGTTSQIMQYIFTDFNAPSGKVYYRLKQIDFDTKFEYHGPVIVTDNSIAAFETFPNPAREKVNVILIGKSEGTIEVLDMSGNILATQPASKATQVDISGFRKGIYMIRYTNQNGVNQKRFMVH